MSLPKWKIENSLCRCCHSDGLFVKLAEPRVVDGETEIYSEMLQKCFNIMMSPVQGELNDQTYSVCEICVKKIRDAWSFKQQVLECEATFDNMFTKNCIEGNGLIENVKIEVDIMNEGNSSTQNWDSESHDDTDKEVESVFSSTYKTNFDIIKESTSLGNTVILPSLQTNQGTKKETPTSQRQRIKQLMMDQSTYSKELLEEEIKKIKLQEFIARQERQIQQKLLKMGQKSQLTEHNLKILNETPEARERRLARHRQYNAERRRNESPETRALRLARIREAGKRRRRQESPASREYRLAQQRQYNRETRSRESPNSREKRLAALSECSDRRRRAESPNSRALRLSQQRIYNERRRSKESPTTSELRHAQMRKAMSDLRGRESPETRKARLEKQRQYSENKRRTESPASRKIRLAKQRKFNEKRRKKKQQPNAEVGDGSMDKKMYRFEDSLSSDSQFLSGIAHDMSTKSLDQPPILRPTPIITSDTPFLEIKPLIVPPTVPFDPAEAMGHYSSGGIAHDMSTKSLDQPPILRPTPIITSATPYLEIKPLIVPPTVPFDPAEAMGHYSSGVLPTIKVEPLNVEWNGD